MGYWFDEGAMKRAGKAVAWGAAGCLLGMGAPARAGEGPAPVIRLGGTNNTASLVLFVGVEKGIFLKNGVDVKLRIFGTGPEMTKALQAGELDITPRLSPTFRWPWSGVSR